MKKIAYIELDTHTEIAQNFMELMQDSHDFSLDYFFSSKILKQTDNTCENIFEVNHLTLYNQLQKTDYDLVIIGTVHRYFNVFKKITAKFNTSIIVHNLNFTKVSRAELFANIFKKDFKYRLKLLLKEGLLSAPNVFNNAANLLVLDKSLTGNDFKFLPVFFLNEFEKARKSIITVVIPGAVSQGRRDYLHILKSIKSFKRNTHFQFILLGKAKGKELSWIKEFEKSKPQNISLKYFSEKVPQKIFDEFIMRADILWCPIQDQTEFFSNTEYYGTTKMSGNVGDAIKYGKLAIFPENYPNSHAFIIPEDKNIEEQIYTYHTGMEFDFQRNFGKEKVSAALHNVLRSLV